MPGSTRWQDLEREIAALRAHFLPEPFDPLGLYSDERAVRRNTRAFVVLSHAEIETFLEDWAKDIAKAAERIWSGGRIAMPLAHLLGASTERVKVPNRDAPAALNLSCTKTFQAYYKSINENHGVREGNLFGMFAPLGVPASAMGGTLIPNLNSFGDLRGVHAHQAARAVRNALDPETEFKKLRDILNDLLVFDEWLVKYRRKIR